MIVNMAMKKYGIDNFTYEVIASCKTQDDANETETLLVKQYESHISTGKGYNVTAGGMNAPKTDAFKQMMRDHWADPEWKENTSKAIMEAHAQRTLEEKEQTSKLLSEALSGRHLSPDTEYQIGHSFAEETLQKMSEIKSGQHISPDTEFKSGHIPYNKGTAKPKIKKTNGNGRFQLGQEPWNKGQHITNVGTFQSGSTHPNAKLNESKVLEIIRLFNSGTKKSNIAQILDIKKDLVYDVLYGKSWSHITGIKKK